VRIERGEPQGTRVICECPIDTRVLEKHRVLRSRNHSVQRIAAKRVGAKSTTGVAKHASAPLIKSKRRAKGEFK
jgi:hypothetical protein